MESADTDNGLPGIESSGSAGGLDVHRQIPLKLISKHMSKAKFVSQIPRTKNGLPVGEEFEYNKEGCCDCKGGQLLGVKKKIPKCLWQDSKMNIIGEKEDSSVHFGNKCDLPLKIYR
uniref:Uncharacterized protein n=2 Tax=Lynx TaxID=13124 RepID=A0A667I9I3_LYNCA